MRLPCRLYIAALYKMGWSWYGVSKFWILSRIIL